MKYIFFLLLLLSNVCFSQDIIGLNPELKTYDAPAYRRFSESNMYEDVLAHCRHPERLNQFRDRKVTYIHEMVHEVNSQFWKQNAQGIYLTNGKYAVILDPGVDGTKIAAIIPAKNRDHLYETYFVTSLKTNKALAKKYLGKDYYGTLYLFDEFSAYVNASFVKEYYKIDIDESEIENSYKFALFCGYVLYYLDTNGVDYDLQIRALYVHQYGRIKSLRDDARYRKILSESEISEYLKKIIDI